MVRARFVSDTSPNSALTVKAWEDAVQGLGIKNQFHKTNKKGFLFRLNPGARFSKVPIINGPVKLLLFTCKVKVSIVLHLT